MKSFSACIFLFAGILIPAVALADIDVQKVTSPQGITAWLVSDDTIPIVALEASFDGGLSAEPDGKEGLATLFVGLLDEGSGDMDTQAFARQADTLGASFGYSAGMDSFMVSGRFLKKNLSDSVDLLAVALQAPRFDADAVARVQQQLLSSLRQQAVDPSSQASKAWNAAALPYSRYGQPALGTLDTVQSLTRQDLTDIQPILLNRQNLDIAVVGDITAQELSALLDQVFADLPSLDRPALPDVSMADRTGRITTQMDVPQSVVQFGHTGLMRDHPDYIPLVIANYIMGGGGFASRLTEEVREKNGLVYSIGSYLVPYQRVGLYLGSFATANETLDQAIDLITAEWASMADTGLTAQELDNAKTYLTGAFPLRFDSNAKIARYLLSVQKYDLGIDYINRYPDLINAVTLEQANTAAKTHLNPDRLLFSITGRTD